ncbi:MAG: hypothetical protein EYC62_09460 [Alphaproteobacteria bacterium]|nr:MAG: hypothetical protein EYC62_09460 [Alphaproteobacteria bacterium]
MNSSIGWYVEEFITPATGIMPVWSQFDYALYASPLYFVGVYFIATGLIMALHQLRGQITMAPMLALGGLLTFLVWQLVQIGWWVDWQDYKINAALLGIIPALLAGATLTYAMDGVRMARAFLGVMVCGAVFGMGYSFFLETLGHVTPTPSLFFTPINTQIALAGSLIISGVVCTIGAELARRVSRLLTLPFGFAAGITVFLPLFSFLTYGYDQGLINIGLEWPEFCLLAAPAFVTLLAYDVMAYMQNALMPKRSIWGVLNFRAESGQQSESITGAREQIAELRQLNQALRQEEYLRHHQMQRSPIALVELDKGWRLRQFNPAAQELLIDHATGQFLAEGCPITDYLPELKTILQDPALIQNRYLKHQLNIKDQQQEKIIELTILPLMVDKVVYGYSLQAEDVSAREQEERRKILSERVHGIHKTSQVIHHDFSNLMLAIQSHLNVIRQKLSGAKDIEANQAIDAVYQASQRGKEMLGQLGAGQVFHKPTLKPVLLFDLIEEATKIIGPQARSQQIAIASAIGKDIRVEVDATQILRVFINLLSNSIRAMPKGGNISIQSNLEQQGVLVSFHDSGVGMNEEQLQKAFDPGFSTKGQGQGGLGLAISYLITEAHGGKLSLISKPGHGTTAKIWLPLLQQVDGEPWSEALNDNETLPAEGILLLLPQNSTRQYLVEKFESMGYEVAELETYQELEAILQEDASAWTILIRSKDDTLPPHLWHQCRYLCDVVIDLGAKSPARIRPSSKSKLSAGDLEKIIQAA